MNAVEQLTIEQILQHGENTTIEFKSWEKAKSMKERVNLAVDELLAFANSRGGTVYFGVEDDGEVTGCSGNYDLQNMLEAIYDKTRPPLFVEYEEIIYQGKKIIALSVKSDGTKYSTADGRFLKRLGKNSKPFYPEEMSHFYTASQSPDFSSQIIADSTTDDINMVEVYNLKQKLKIRDAIYITRIGRYDIFEGLGTDKRR